MEKGLEKSGKAIYNVEKKQHEDDSEYLFKGYLNGHDSETDLRGAACLYGRMEKPWN